MNKLRFGLCAAVAFVAMRASSGVISDPIPDATPADSLTWEDFGGTVRTTTANWDARDQTYSWSNGGFDMTKASWQKGMTLNIGDDFTLNSSGEWHGPTGASTDLHRIRIFAGGVFNVTGGWDPNWTQLQVDRGGKFLFRGTSLKSNNSADRQSWFDVYGLLEAPAGLRATGNLRLDLITHADSEIRLGGDVTRNGNSGATLRWLVKGGTITALEDVSFDCAELQIAANASVTLSVAAGKTFDLRSFVGGDGGELAKTGAGAVSIGTVPPPLTANEGTVLMNTAADFDLSNVRIADGAALKVGVRGIAIAAYDESLLALARINLDSSLVSEGSTVLSVCDADLATWAVKAVNAGLPSGFEAYADGTLVKLRLVVASKTTVWTGAGADANWSTAANWDAGTPSSGDTISFGAEGTGTTMNDLADLVVSSVIFGSGAPARAIGGIRSLSVFSAITNLSEETQVFDLPISFSGSAVSLHTAGDVVFSAISGSSVVKDGSGTAMFSKGYSGNLAIDQGRVVVASGMKLSEAAGAVTVNGILDLGGGSLTITQPDSAIASIGAGAVLTNGTFTYRSDKVVYNGASPAGRAFMWTGGAWTIARDATVVTDGQIFEYGPDAPAATYGVRRILIDGGTLQCTSSSTKYVIGVDDDFDKPAVIELKNGGSLQTTGNNEFHIGARNSGQGTSHRARGMVIASDSTIEINDQLRMLNEHPGYKPNSAILALTNSVLSLTAESKTHEVNANGGSDSEAVFILSHSTASFYQMHARARTGTGSMAGRKTGVLALDAATLRPVKATEKFVYNEGSAEPALELQAGGATIDTSYDITLPAAAYGIGGLAKTGSGTLTLASTNVYAGATVVKAGALKLTGRVAGAIEVGAEGTLDLGTVTTSPAAVQAASLSFAEGATLKVTVPGSGPCPIMLLAPGAAVTGVPKFEVTGATGTKFILTTRVTSAGVLCILRQPTGIAVILR